MFDLSTYLLGLAALGASTLIVWFLSLVRRDASIIDLFWSLTFIVAAVVYATVTDAPSGVRTTLTLVLVTVWGLRLSGYLTWRNWGEPEDYRYARMRERGGPTWPYRSLLSVFWGQAVLAWIVSAPLLAGIDGRRDLGILALVGIATWVVGLFFEAVGDWQLSLFKRNPENQGKVLDSGLWSTTRHPNYFGDFMIWWGLFLIAADAGGWWSIFGPIVMTVMLMRVSGVTLLERKLTRTRTGYDDYVRTTNAFFPGPKKHRN
jgi:steroid 5-alpha reductase family enzyme